MSEEKQDNAVEPSESGHTAVSRRNVYIAAAVLLIVILGAVLLWFITRGEEGKVVPAPRSMSVDVDVDPAGDGSGAEQTVTIAPDQVDRIGLRVETVDETLSNEAMATAATGVVQANAYRESPVISLLGGVVRRVNAELGQSVGRGQTLAVVFSDELAASQARYLTLQTEAQTARQNYDRTARLVKISPVSNTELDQTLARLKTVQSELEENRKRYERSVRLLEIGAISREELDQATTKFRTSEADVQEAKRRYDRAVQVAQINPVSRGEFEQAAVKRQTAETELATARQRLLLYGLPPGRVNALRSASQITSEIALTSPTSGVVTKRDVNTGQVVEANKELMRVTDLSSVWVIAQVFEKDLASIRSGSGASVTTDAYPGRLFRGQVTYVDPNISPETRTLQARVELDNPGQVLKIGMYVNVAFGSMGTAERTMPSIPTSAVQNMNDRQVVFVPTDSPNVFVVRPVRLGTESNGRFTVLEGLNVGDKIVTEGSFLLRAELLKQNPTQN
jgi:RND family efflux transporter MFP subunit